MEEEEVVAVESDELIRGEVVREEPERERRIGTWRACLRLSRRKKSWRIEELDDEEVVVVKECVPLVTSPRTRRVLVKELEVGVEVLLDVRRREPRRVWKVRRTRRVL